MLGRSVVSLWGMVTVLPYSDTKTSGLADQDYRNFSDRCSQTDGGRGRRGAA